MSKTSTNQDIVKYVYNELEEEKQNQFNFKYLTDSKIRDEVEMLSNTKKVLDDLFLLATDIKIPAPPFIQPISKISPLEYFND